MATVQDIKNDPNYVQVHEHGFVGLVDSMGSDESIVRAARTSYAKGTKTVNDDRTLIRYLVRHLHTSPIEMGELVFHIKLPIFVMRQLVRHRTASLNEVSARYSELPEEFYVPAESYLQPQSLTNKQGRSGIIELHQKSFIKKAIEEVHSQCYTAYKGLLGPGTIGDNYPGLTRELSRIILPVSAYTECYWKCDLKNFLHMCGLRRDSHAQMEIQDFANPMYNFAKQKFPLVCEAWEDYSFNAKTFSRMELMLLKKLVANTTVDMDLIEQLAPTIGMSKRETREFLEWINAEK